MNLTLVSIRKKLAHCIVAVFLLAILASAAVSELFESPILPFNIAQLAINPISEQTLEELKKIQFKNRFGEFSLELLESKEGEKVWYLVKPRKILAKAEILESFKTMLSSIQVKKLHQDEPINLSSFSLDRPSAEIILQSTNSSDVFLKMGLVNPINNSTYLQVSGHNSLYQIQELPMAIESSTFNDFVESKIFSPEFTEIDSLEILIRQGTRYQRRLFIKKQKNGWVDDSGQSLVEDRVFDFFNSLSGLRANIILDELSDSMESLASTVFKRSDYKITIRKGDQTLGYQISGVLGDISELKIEKNRFVMVKAPDRPFLYIVDKKALGPLSSSTKKMRDISVKKVFY